MTKTKFQEGFYIASDEEIKKENGEVEMQLEDFYKQYKGLLNRFRFYWSIMRKKDPKLYKDPTDLNGWIKQLILYLENENF